MPWLVMSYMVPLGVPIDLSISIVAAVTAILILLEQLHCVKKYFWTGGLVIREGKLQGVFSNAKGISMWCTAVADRRTTREAEPWLYAGGWALTSQQGPRDFKDTFRG